MDILILTNTEQGLIVMMILIVLASLVLGWIVKKVMHLIYSRRTSKHKVDPGKYVLIIFITRLILFCVGVGYAISLDPNIESATTSFLASAGVATIIVGFAAKDVLSNLVSGIMIIVFRPFTISHWIKVENVTEGTVEEIKLLYTVITDITNRRLIIPNSKILSSDIINSSYRNEDVIQMVMYEISYEDDFEKAKKIIRDIAEASPLSMDKRTKLEIENNDPFVEVGLYKLGAYSITLCAFIWVENPKDAITINWCLNQKVREQFNQAGIEIPYPNLVVRDIHEEKLQMAKK